MDFSLFRPLEFFIDPKNGDGRNNNPLLMGGHDFPGTQPAIHGKSYDANDKMNVRNVYKSAVIVTKKA